MAVSLFTHADMLDHRPGPGHVESPERLRAVIDALEDDANLDLEPLEAPLVDPADLLRVHPAAFVDSIFAAAPHAGIRALDPDTVMSAGSLVAARRAAGAVAAAVRHVARGEGSRAFCA
ncbi:MAG: histone deacetylase family protein, partial [Caulobacter sp.]